MRKDPPRKDGKAETYPQRFVKKDYLRYEAGAPRLGKIPAEPEKAGLNVIQLHGGESYEYINEVKERFPGCLVWAARHIADADEIESALSCPADRLVLDAANGGSGMVCDWSLAARVAAARPVMLAGGLNAGNIAEAVKSVNPFGVDLSSGVESGKKGIKSHIKLKEIFNILREIR